MTHKDYGEADKRFDEKFTDLYMEYPNTCESLKSFIHSEKDLSYQEGYAKAREEAIKETQRLRNMRMIGIQGESNRAAKFKNDGWHDALKKIQKFLSSLTNNNQDTE